MTVASWASVSDVSTLTGVTVTDAQLTQAQGLIDIHAGRTYAALDRTGTRDAAWLKAAVAYQAAWLTGQPDLFQRLDVTEIPQDRGTPPAITEKALVLAPMAKWALKRVSWLKSRSLHVRSAFVDGSGALSLSATSEVNDAYESWSAI